MHSLAALRLRLLGLAAVKCARPVGTPASDGWYIFFLHVCALSALRLCLCSLFFLLVRVLSALRLRLCVLSSLNRRRQNAQSNPTQPPDHAQAKKTGCTSKTYAAARTHTCKKNIYHPSEPYAADRASTFHSSQAEQPKPTQPPDCAPEIYFCPIIRTLRSRQSEHHIARSRHRCKESAQLLSRALCACTAYPVHLLICVRAQLLVYILFVFCVYFYII